MQTKILLIDPFSDSLLNQLYGLKVPLKYLPDIQREGVEKEIADAHILILNSKVNVDKALIDKAPHLKLVIRAGVGMDHFDLPYGAQKGILMTNTAGANADSVAEHTIGMLLGLRHKLFDAFLSVKNMEWIREAHRGMEIKGKNVGIIGYGNTGSALARKLKGFECNIWVYDKYKTGFGDEYVTECDMETLFEKSDILSLHIPLTDETRNLANAAFFASFKKPITFLNLSRGEIVHLSDLLHAMDRFQVKAVGLDVLENEKLSTLTQTQKFDYQRLFQRPNVIVTPHIGGWSVESKTNIENEIYRIVSLFLQQNLP